MAKGAAEPAARKLKVYRTAIGFHDAYVAAPSKKAALAAWGTDKDLFARGAAEVVDDPALTADALAAAGTVIRRTRGSLAEQLHAAGDAPRSATDPKASHTPPPKPRKPVPRPSRTNLDATEAALSAAQAKAEADRAALRREEDALRQRREALEHDQRQVLAKLSDDRDRARDAYEAGMTRWRADG